MPFLLEETQIRSGQWQEASAGRSLDTMQSLISSSATAKNQKNCSNSLRNCVLSKSLGVRFPRFLKTYTTEFEGRCWEFQGSRKFDIDWNHIVICDISDNANTNYIDRYDDGL